MSGTQTTHEHWFVEAKRYVNLGPDEEALLAGVGPRIAPHIPAIVDDFYAHIRAHEGTLTVITGGDAQVTRLMCTLQRWIAEFFAPPYDEAYYEHRARIGRRHVEINLPQRYMFTAIALIRSHFNRIALDTASDEATAVAEVRAINALLDLELAVMLHTYREDHLLRLQRGERLATFGELVASIAHELRNPMGVIDSSLFIMRKRLAGADEAVTRHLDRIDAQVRHSDKIITSLLDMVRERPASPLAVAPARLVRMCVDSLHNRHGVRFEVEIADEAHELCLHVDPDQVVQVLVNLSNNAYEAVSEGGEVRLSVTVDKAWVRFLVNDDGPGLDPHVRVRLYEPLVTTKVHGIGLGLPLCKRLVERNQGRIGLCEGPLPGAAFEAVFPRLQPGERP